jgi:hypothetical protein
VRSGRRVRDARAVKAKSLLSEVAGLSPSVRTARVVRVARELQRSDPRTLEGVLADLSAGDVYARRLAVVMAAAAGQGERLALAASDEVPAVETLAVAAEALPDQVVVEMLASGSMALRRLVCRRLRRDRREDLAVSCLPVVRARWGDREAATLLATCNEATVRRLLPNVA